MSQKIILKYRNPEVLWASAGYILMSSLLLMLRVKNGSFFIGIFILLVILIVWRGINKYCETVITDEGITTRTILLKKNRYYVVEDQKLSLIHIRTKYSMDRKISVVYGRKVLSQHQFDNDSALEKFREITRNYGYQWKKTIL